jgi:hypothetical protein
MLRVFDHSWRTSAKWNTAKSAKKEKPTKKVMLTGTIGSRRLVTFHAPSSD